VNVTVVRVSTEATERFFKTTERFSKAALPGRRTRSISFSNLTFRLTSTVEIIFRAKELSDGVL
jgi:hypothetical protein